MRNMKSSSLPSELPKILAGAVLGVLFTSPCLAQDTLIMKAGPERKGEVLSVTNRTISLQAGPAKTTVPLDQVVKVVKAPPADFTAAQEALKSGDYAKALPLIKAVTDKFFGLPSPWAETAAAELGDAYVGLNQIAEAEKAFEEFKKAYPQSINRANLGTAQIAIEKQNPAEAKALLAPIIEEAAKVAQAGGDKGATYGRAYYLMGRVEEAEGNSAAALQDYLTTVTLFYQDPAITAKAQQKADQLGQKSISVP
jgi:tetratricopeptide (TPR) repeat protein